MKITLSTVILGLVLLFTGAAQAQLYDLYYYWDGAQYQQYWPQQYDLYPYGNTNQYSEQLYDPYSFCTTSYIYRSTSPIFINPAALPEVLLFQNDRYEADRRDRVASPRGDRHRLVGCHR